MKISRHRAFGFAALSFCLVSAVLRTLWLTPPQQVDTAAILRKNTFPPDTYAPFPRWSQEGILFGPFLRFLQGTVNRTATTVAKAKQRSRFPETLYVIRHNGVWVSRKLRQRSWKQMQTNRIDPTEGLFHTAWSVLNNTTEASSRWPRLHHSMTTAGVPFLAWYGDYKSCNYHNWQARHSIPLFTTCAPHSCHHAFPIPTYHLIQHAQPTAADWDDILEKQQRSYHAKIPEVVWRGSLSASNEHWNSTRWRLTLAANSELNFTPRTRLNVGLTSIPPINDDQKTSIRQKASLIRGIMKPPIQPMGAFQRYLAILDVDGNSWSSRFGSLLCYNSVVVKVEPDYVEHFYSKNLKPWVHFVPVRGDLSDLADAVMFVTTQPVKHIVANANQWCRDHLSLQSLTYDMLDIWEMYVSFLERGDSRWGEKWTTAWDSFVTLNFDMALLR